MIGRLVIRFKERYKTRYGILFPPILNPLQDGEQVKVFDRVGVIPIRFAAAIAAAPEDDPFKVPSGTYVYCWKNGYFYEPLAFADCGYSSGSGASGYSGYSGFSGYSGSSGESGASATGLPGVSGYSGLGGASGYSGAVGTSGFSGAAGTGQVGIQARADIVASG